MSGFDFNFDDTNYQRLDNLALKTWQDNSNGNKNNWFLDFRGGLHGLYSRIYGLTRHYYYLHAWIPMVRNPVETEYQLASILFNMDSAIECFTFALNALGNSIDPSLFRDISSEKELKKIKPADIFGTDNNKQLQGYLQYFPLLQAYWQANSNLLFTITEQHDVSKHRQTTYLGGQLRLDAPVGFYEALRIGDNPSGRASYWPMAETILYIDPKSPNVNKDSSLNSTILLETVVTDFSKFIQKTGEAILKDFGNYLKNC